MDFIETFSNIYIMDFDHLVLSHLPPLTSSSLSKSSPFSWIYVFFVNPDFTYEQKHVLLVFLRQAHLASHYDLFHQFPYKYGWVVTPLCMDLLPKFIFFCIKNTSWLFYLHRSSGGKISLSSLEKCIILGIFFLSF